MPVTSARVCTILVGRADELTLLNDVLATALGGEGTLCVLLGEPGAGKSRLVAELSRYAITAGFHIMEGGCSERDRDFPFAPFVDALRQCLVTSATMIPPESWPGLAPILPEIGTVSDVAGTIPGLAPEQAKRRLFEAIVAFLAQRSIVQPLVLVLEDLHWADSASLELLEILPRRLSHSRIVIVATARRDESNGALQECLTSLRRNRALVEVSVDLLDAPSTGRMLEALLGQTISPAVSALVHRRTGGNPFLVEELVSTVPAGAGPAWLLDTPIVPVSLRQRSQQEASGLSVLAQRVINLVALAGNEEDFKVLLATAGGADDQLLPALRTLVARNILVEKGTTSHPRYAFRHALLGDAYRAHLLAPERRELHQEIGEARERLARLDDPSPATCGDLGFHFHAAGVWAKALPYARQAMEAAWGVNATREALSHGERALEAAIAIDDSGVPDLHRRCAQALGILGSFSMARDHFEAALAIERQRDDRRAERILLDDLAGLYASRDYGIALDYAETALRLAREAGESQDQANALNRLGNILVNVRRFDEGRAMHEMALRIHAESDNKSGQADSHDLIGMARYLAGEIPEAREAFRQAASTFSTLGNVERVASALTTRGLYLAVLDGWCATDASPGIARADAIEGLRLSQNIAWRAGEIYALVAIACADIGDGFFGDARHHGELALAQASEIGHDQWKVIALMTLGILATETFDFEGARERFTHATTIAKQISAGQWLERLDAWLLWCDVQTGGGGAVAMPPLPDGHPGSIGQRRLVIAHIEGDLATGNPERSLEVLDSMFLEASGPRSANVLLLRGCILARLGRLQEADANFLDARQIAINVGPTSVAWQVSAARSRIWKGRDEACSRLEASRARQELQILAGSLADPQYRAAFLRSPVVRPWAGAPPRDFERTASGFGGLTARERDVAIQIAQGASNKEIARTLGISEKTVEMHVSNGLGKLNFVSRAQLAAWVVTEGLTSAAKIQG